MNEIQLEEIIRDLGVTKVRKRGNWLMGCCPIHGEKNPSWGINLDPPHMSNCFSCGYQSITVAHLIAEVKGISLERAREIVGDKTNSEFQVPRYKMVRRFEDEEERFNVLPRTILAPYKCGRETHEYFFERGFNEETARIFEVGYDKSQKRIIVPIRWRNGMIAGFAGRSVLHDDRVRWFYYNNFKKSELLFPLDLVEFDDWVIVVEGPFDAMWMYQLGFKNTLALMGSKISNKQADWIMDNCNYVVAMLDNDEAGVEGTERLIEYMRKRSVDVFVTKYPKGKNDPAELTKKDVKSMLKSKRSWYRKNIDRIS